MLEKILMFVWDREMVVIACSVMLMQGLLWRAKPEERRWLRNTFSLFLFSMVGLLLAGAAQAAGLTNMAPVLREALTLLAGFAVVRLAGRFFLGYLVPMVVGQSPRILEDILVILGYIGLILHFLHHIGLELTQLVAGSAILTAVIGFSMQDTLGNLLGGIVLELDDTFRVGDWIKVDDLVGRVINIEWRTVTIETRNWERVVIPNSSLIKSKFLVLGKKRGAPDYWRRWIWFNVDLEHPPARVIAEVEKALRGAEIPNVAKEPSPSCLLMSFESGYGHYAVRYWLTDLLPDDPTDSAVRVTIFTALARAGMDMALTQQSVWMRKDNEKLQKKERAKEVAEREILLGNVDLFRALGEEEIRLLAERLTYSPFMAGEVVTRQGNQAHWLYILASGEVEVFWQDEQRRVDLGRMKAVTVFGEMSLMTGEPRSATVLAVTDLECYRLDKPSFESILLARPSLAEELSRIMAQRRMNMEMAKGIEMEKTSEDQHSSQILAGIRRFFSLS